MDKTNLLSQSTEPRKRITILDLPSQLVELSDQDLQQIVGGIASINQVDPDEIPPLPPCPPRPPFLELV
jgi:bacteriocin-like protein